MSKYKVKITKSGYLFPYCARVYDLDGHFIDLSCVWTLRGAKRVAKKIIAEQREKGIPKETIIAEYES